MTDLHVLVPWNLVLECVGDDKCLEVLREMERVVEELVAKKMYVSWPRFRKEVKPKKER